MSPLKRFPKFWGARCVMGPGCFPGSRVSPGRGCSCRESAGPSLHLQLPTQGYFPPSSAILHLLALVGRFCRNSCP